MNIVIQNIFALGGHAQKQGVHLKSTLGVLPQEVETAPVSSSIESKVRGTAGVSSTTRSVDAPVKYSSSHKEPVESFVGANQGAKFGLDAELAAKKAAGYDTKLEQEASQWLTALTGIEQEGDFESWLRDGTVLCKAINVISPHSVTKINTSSLAFKQMENISNYLDATSAYGVLKSDTFQTVDLYEGKNMMQVIQNIHALGGLAQKNGHRGPALGVKVAEKHETSFTEEQLRAGAYERPLLDANMNKGASQKGIGPGLGHQIVKTSDAGSTYEISRQTTSSGPDHISGSTAPGMRRQIA